VLNRTDGGSHGRDGDPIARTSLQSASHGFIYISCEPQVVLIKEREHRDVFMRDIAAFRNTHRGDAPLSSVFRLVILPLFLPVSLVSHGYHI